MIKKSIIATTLAASAVASVATPAMARDRYYRHGDNTAAVAIGVGILGLAVGAIAASNHNDRYRDRYYDRRYSTNDGYYYNNRYYDRSDRYTRDWQRNGDRYNRYNGYDDRYYYRRGY